MFVFLIKSVRKLQKFIFKLFLKGKADKLLIKIIIYNFFFCFFDVLIDDFDSNTWCSGNRIIIRIIMHFLKAKSWQYNVRHTLYFAIVWSFAKSICSFTCYRKWFDYSFFLLWFNKDNTKVSIVIIFFCILDDFNLVSLSAASTLLIPIITMFYFNLSVLTSNILFFLAWLVLMCVCVCVLNWSAWNAHSL